MSRTRYMIYFIDFALLFIFNLFIQTHIQLALLFAFCQLLGIYAFRSYDLKCLSNFSESIFRTLFGMGFGFLVILIFYPVLYKYFDNWVFAFNGVFTLTVLPLLHKIVYHFYIKNRAVKNYLVIGDRNELEPLLNEIEEKSLHKLKFIDYFLPQELTPQINYTQYDCILITHSSHEKNKNEIHLIKKSGLNIDYLPILSERYLRRVPIIVAEKFREYYEIYFENIDDDPTKRLMDIFTSILALIIFFPFMIIIGLLILIEDGIPIIIKQKRMGMKINPFLMYKFRSLSELNKNDHSPNANIEHRILKVGKFIRKTRLDETMQFINVLIGNMSIVGPRPEMIQFHTNSTSQIPFYNYRLKTKPGITGWAQINYKHTSTLEDYAIKTEYDLYYVKNRNIFLDIKIMIKTFEAMLGMRGAR